MHCSCGVVSINCLAQCTVHTAAGVQGDTTLGRTVAGICNTNTGRLLCLTHMGSCGGYTTCTSHHPGLLLVQGYYSTCASYTWPAVVVTQRAHHTKSSAKHTHGQLWFLLDICTLHLVQCCRWAAQADDCDMTYTLTWSSAVIHSHGQL